MYKKLQQAILFTGLSIVTLLTGSNAVAAMGGDYYVSANLAANWLQTQNYRLMTGNEGPGSFLRLPSDTGMSGGLAIGVQNEAYRLEAALDYFINNVKNGTQYDGFFLAPVSASGKVITTALLVNGYYDFMPQSIWTPYVGVGLGIANIHPSFSTNSPQLFIATTLHDNTVAFACQGIAGVAWKVSEHVKATLDYRYLRTATATFTIVDGLRSSGTALSRYASNRVTGGVSYYFN